MKTIWKVLLFIVLTVALFFTIYAFYSMAFNLGDDISFPLSILLSVFLSMLFVKLTEMNYIRNKVRNNVLKAKKLTAGLEITSRIVTAESYAEEARELLNEAIPYEKKINHNSLAEQPSNILSRMEQNFQWKLRDAIEREESDLKKLIDGRYHNNKKACCINFYEEIQRYKDSFSEETLDFAMDAYYRVCEYAELTQQSQGELVEGKSAISDVDGMDGHDFEEFCADLLRKNGFSNVDTTKGSGDQGVDIIAEKDGIKYAIQCKCYSSDLGNKPIQEVFAGKSIYNCHVACVMTNRYFTPGGLEASKATGVLLWDRRKLQELIEIANKN